MFTKRKKVLCYMLVFDQYEIIRKTLESIKRYADQIELVIMENPSANTPRIKKMIMEYGNQGIVKRYYLFDENITSNTFKVVFTRELETIRRRPYVIMTDGDLTSDDDWLTEELGVMKKHPEVFCIGVTLDKSNLPLQAFPAAKDWIPPDKAEHEDYYETFTGGHFQMLRGRELVTFFEWSLRNKIRMIDGAQHTYCYQELGAKWARTKHAKGYHLTWDLYADKSNSYTKFRESKTFEETWLHERVSDYQLTEF